MASTGAGWNRDAVVGIVGAAVLVAAMAGVFLYERGQFREYAISWETSEAGTVEQPGSADVGDATDHTFTITAEDLPESRSLAQAQATVTWEDDVGQPDTFTVEVTGPDGASGGLASDDSGSVTTEARINAEPAATTATGRTPEAAADQAAQAEASDAGLGEWTVTVTLDEAPGDPGGPGGVNSQEDGSNDYTVTLAWDVWEPVVSG